MTHYCPEVLALALMALPLTGCGKAPQLKDERLVQATGHVMLDGKPADGVRVLFHPTGNNHSFGGCWAVCDANGRFSVMDVSNDVGIPAGPYHVTFSKIQNADGTPLGPMDSPTTSMAQEIVAEQWSSLVKAGPHNKVDISPDGALELNFKITSAPKRKVPNRR